MCEFIAPQVFEVTDVSHIKQNFNLQENIDLIEKSVRECPVYVIKYEEKK
jgi:ferredoxin